MNPDELIKQAAEREPAPRRRIGLTKMASVQRRAVAIVPCGLSIPVGTVSVICGLQGLGKSLITCYAAAELTRNGYGVVFVAEEDSIGAVVKPRLEAARAHLDRVYFPEVEARDDLGGILLPRDTSDLAELAEEHRVRLVVLDPWTNHVDVDYDKGKVRATLMPIARAAGTAGFAVLLVAHPTKRTDGDPLSQIAHASAVSQISRSAFFLGRDPEYQGQPSENPYRLLAQEKASHTPNAATLRFKIESVLLPATDGEPEVTTARVVSEGMSMLDWPGICQLERSRTARPDESSATGRAEAWLLDELGDGVARPRPDVLEAGEDAGHAERTLVRAAKHLTDRGLLLSKQDPPNPAVWVLAVQDANGSTPSRNVGALGVLGALVEESQKRSTPAREGLNSAVRQEGQAPRSSANLRRTGTTDAEVRTAEQRNLFSAEGGASPQESS